MQQEPFKSLEKQFQKFSLPPWEPKVKETNKNLIAEGARPQEEITYKRKNSADTSEKVFRNNDKRVRVASTKNFPESTQVFLKMNFGKDVPPAYGSGQMIGPYHVLTCAHNIYDLDMNYEWAQEIIAYPGANGEEYIPFKGIAAVKAIIPLSWKDGQEDADIGLILLEKDIGFQTGWANFAYWQDEEFNDVDILVSGYPGDKPFGTLYEMSGRILHTTKAFLYYEISTAPGQSGGPIWKRGSFPVVLGVHCRAGPKGKKWNEGTRISEKYFYWITACMEMNHAAATCKERGQGCKVESLDFEQSSNLIHLCDNDGNKYTGQYKEGKVRDYDIMVPIKQGFGLAIQKYGERYKGHFLKGKRHGYGICKSPDGTQYVGQWKLDKKEGQGKLTWADGRSYEGPFYQNERHDDGSIYRDSDGSVYIGKWRNDKKDGYGCHTFPDGSYYRGKFCQDERHGQGAYKYTDGRIYEGQWRYGRKEGQGKLTQTDGNTEVYSYEGEFYDDLKHGQGTEKFKDGSMYTGQWKNGRKEGQGKFILSDGSCYEELYLDGKIYDPDDSPFSGNMVSNGQETNDEEEEIEFISPENDQINQEQYAKNGSMRRSLKKFQIIQEDDEPDFSNQVAGDKQTGDPRCALTKNRSLD